MVYLCIVTLAIFAGQLAYMTARHDQIFNVYWSYVGLGISCLFINFQGDYDNLKWNVLLMHSFNMIAAGVIGGFCIALSIKDVYINTDIVIETCIIWFIDLVLSIVLNVFVNKQLKYFAEEKAKKQSFQQ